MTIEATGTEERIGPRTRRAAEESMTVVPAGCGEFEVWSGANLEPYIVDLANGECTCPDMQHHAPADGCKHIRRVEMEAAIRDIPDLGHRTDVEVMRGARMGSEEPADEPLVADGGSTCPEGHPGCEGVESGRERPVLCWDCWQTWS